MIHRLLTYAVGMLALVGWYVLLKTIYELSMACPHGCIASFG